MKAKEFIPASKPRNPNWKTLQTIRTSNAAGSHLNKKKAEKQGDFKYKDKQFEQGVADK